MRWEIVDETLGPTCEACEERERDETASGHGPEDTVVHYNPADADEGQTRWLEMLFSHEAPTICELCLEGVTEDADGWLERRIDAYLDPNVELRGAIHKVIEVIDDYKYQAIEDDSIQHLELPEELAGSLEDMLIAREEALRDYEPGNPDLRVELAFIEIIPVWLNLELFRVGRYRNAPPDSPEEEERQNRQKQLNTAYQAGMAKLYRACRVVYGEGGDPPRPHDGA
jgi:hypothetical protein